MPPSARVWGLRVLAFSSLILICNLANSGVPALAFAVTWGPNGLFLTAFMRGALQLPRFLEPVNPIEPVLYRWLGVGLVKRIVETREWPLMWGFEPPPKIRNRQEFLDRTEHSARGAEICHGATLVLVLAITIYCVAVGRNTEATWLLAFNLLFNGYPVMLQRSHRWRIQQVRAQARKKQQE